MLLLLDGAAVIRTGTRWRDVSKRWLVVSRLDHTDPDSDTNSDSDAHSERCHLHRILLAGRRG